MYFATNLSLLPTLWALSQIPQFSPAPPPPNWRINDDGHFAFLQEIMKSLEQEFDIATQDILLKTVKSITEASTDQEGTQWNALTRLLSKTNVKLGGLNYALRLEDSKL